MAEDYSYDATPKDRAAATCPQVASIISMIGSYVIMREVIVDHRQKRGKAIPRILFELCIADLVFSSGWLLGTWPSPSDLPDRWDNFGNTATCEFQGFLLNFGLLASPIFNISLAFFYYLMICHNWKDAKLTKLEPWIHGGIWLFSLVGAIFPIPLGLYNNAWTVCWFQSVPAGCKDSFRYGDEGNCTRGDNAWIYAVAFTVFPVVTCVILSFVIMGMIFAYVRKTERRATRYSGLSSVKTSTDPISAAGNSNATAAAAVVESGKHSYRHSASSTSSTETNQSNSPIVGGVPTLARAEKWRYYYQHSGSSMSSTESTRTNSTIANIAGDAEKKRKSSRSLIVAAQGIFYSLSFIATYALHCVCTLIFFTTGKSWYWLHFTMYFFLSLQGFFNCLVFIRKREMKTPEGRWLKKVVCWNVRAAVARETMRSSRTHRTSSQELPAIQEDAVDDPNHISYLEDTTDSPACDLENIEDDPTGFPPEDFEGNDDVPACIPPEDLEGNDDVPIHTPPDDSEDTEDDPASIPPDDLKGIDDGPAYRSRDDLEDTDDDPAHSPPGKVEDTARCSPNDLKGAAGSPPNDFEGTADSSPEDLENTADDSVRISNPDEQMLAMDIEEGDDDAPAQRL